MQISKQRRKALKARYKASTTSIWYSHPTTASTIQALKDLYDTYFPDAADAATWNILCRYEGKLSLRLLGKKKLLEIKGRRKANEMFSDAFHNPLPYPLPKEHRP